MSATAGLELDNLKNQRHKDRITVKSDRIYKVVNFKQFSLKKKNDIRFCKNDVVQSDFDLCFIKSFMKLCFNNLTNIKNKNKKYIV